MCRHCRPLRLARHCSGTSIAGWLPRGGRGAGAGGGALPRCICQPVSSGQQLQLAGVGGGAEAAAAAAAAAGRPVQPRLQARHGTTVPHRPCPASHAPPARPPRAAAAPPFNTLLAPHPTPPARPQDTPKALHKCIPTPEGKERGVGFHSAITVGSLLPSRMPLMKGSIVEVLATPSQVDFIVTNPEDGNEMMWQVGGWVGAWGGWITVCVGGGGGRGEQVPGGQAWKASGCFFATAAAQQRRAPRRACACMCLPACLAAFNFVSGVNCTLPHPL